MSRDAVEHYTSEQRDRCILLATLPGEMQINTIATHSTCMAMQLKLNYCMSSIEATTFKIALHRWIAREYVMRSQVQWLPVLYAHGTQIESLCMYIYC